MKMESIKSALTWEPLVSVVINFYNERDNVDMAPACLCEQTYKNFEVILVDDSSTDGTAEEIIRRYGGKLPRLRVIRIDKPLGLRPARRKGVMVAKGDIIVTLDLHTLFDKDFLKKVVHFFQEDSTLGAVGPLVLPYGERWFIKGDKLTALFLFVLIKKILKGYKYAPGTAAAYRRDLLERIGFLSIGELMEDIDASWKISSLGFNVKISEDLIVYHKSPYGFFAGWLLRKLNEGKRLFIVFLNYPQKVVYPQLLIRLLFLPFLAIVLLLLGELTIPVLPF